MWDLKCLTLHSQRLTNWKQVHKSRDPNPVTALDNEPFVYFQSPWFRSITRIPVSLHHGRVLGQEQPNWDDTTVKGKRASVKRKWSDWWGEVPSTYFNKPHLNSCDLQTQHKGQSTNLLNKVRCWRELEKRYGCIHVRILLWQNLSLL